MSKRAHESEPGGASKKLRSDISNGDANERIRLAGDALIAQKRAEIAAKLAVFGGTKTKASDDPSAISAPSDSSTRGSLAEEFGRRIAEAKKRSADAQSKGTTNPYLNPTMPKSTTKKAVETTPQGAGLKMAAHPLLLDTSTPAPQSKKDRYKPMQPKFASIKANLRNQPILTPPPAPAPAPVPIEVKANPYASRDDASGSFEGAAPKERTSRSLRFNQKGKYVQIATQMRQEVQLEQLKQRIAEGAKKAGLDSEFETVEKSIRREAPPEAEWWDVALLPNKTYDDVIHGLHTLNIHTAESPINIYVQHPIPIPAPGDKNKPEFKALILTKKEQKKMRKQRRQAELQDKRDRIRMGLIPPDPNKVRLSNLMKVLTTDAVQDPTRVEARVRREVAMRKHNHEKMNVERKLTDEQRREKIENKKVQEERKGLVGAIFKIRTLSDPSHRFKVKKNAEQSNLTGVCIFHPSFSMVYVEGAAKFIRFYKRLMLQRMQWTEAARARHEEDVEIEGDGGEKQTGTSMMDGPGEGGQGEEYGTTDLAQNRCDLVWEGDVRERVFKNFKPRSCPTDAAAKEILGTKMAGYWDQTKNWKPADDEIL